MKTLHILIALTLSTSTHLIFILGIQDTTTPTPTNNINPIQINLNTSQPSAHALATKTRPQTSTEKNKLLLPSKTTTKQHYTNTNRPTPSQIVKSPPTTNPQKNIKPTSSKTQITPPFLAKKTMPPPKKTNKIITPLPINNQQSDILSEAHSLTQITTRYPSFSRRRGEEGTVKLAIHIDKDGHVTKVDIVNSSGHQRLDLAAKTAVEQASFTPATLNDKVVASIKKLSVRFDLRDPS